jgi:integrase/recombinase XerD
MKEVDLVSYFGKDILNELLYFYKKQTLTEFVEKQVSLHNINIALIYLKDVRRGGVTPQTLVNNKNFISWLLYRYKKDLDKITEQDRDDILDLIDDWIMKNGKPAAPTSKHMYKAEFKKFLDRYGNKTRNKELKDVSNFKITNAKPKTKLPEDMLTETEIAKLISCAEGIRDKAMIAVLFESGARIGEIENCKFRHVQEFHRGTEHGYRITLKGKTGERQVIIYRFQQWLRIWLEICKNIDPDTPLFPTTRKYADDSFSNDEKLRAAAKDKPHDYVPLKSKRFNIILRAAANKAGIRKDVHAHLLRHSQCTRCANTMTEQQLKTQFGWTSGSNMTSVYIHLSGKDTEKAMLKSYGIVVEEDEKGNKIEHCVQCHSIISPGFILCPICGNSLSGNMLISKDELAEKVKEEMDKIIFEHFKELMKETGNDVNKLIKDMKK